MKTEQEIHTFINKNPDPTLDQIIQLYKAIQMIDCDGVIKVRKRLDNGNIVSNWEV